MEEWEEEEKATIESLLYDMCQELSGEHSNHWRKMQRCVYTVEANQWGTNQHQYLSGKDYNCTEKLWNDSILVEGQGLLITAKEEK